LEALAFDSRINSYSNTVAHDTTIINLTAI